MRADGSLRILVTGSRVATDSESAFVRSVLNRITAEARVCGRPVIVVQGECPYGGVDLAAREWAENSDGTISEGHPAAWDQHGKAAGLIRNSEMVSAGADLCLAFPRRGSRGTWDCIRKAADAGVPVRIYPLD